MNLLLLLPEEIQDSGRIRLSDRRALHLRRVLGVTPGRRLRAGILNHALVQVEVVSAGEQEVELGLVGPPEVVPPPTTSLVLAVPRPKALSRVVNAAASFGLRKLVLINAWRVERSYFSSPKLEISRLRGEALLGAEQGRQVWLPEIHVIPSFRKFVEDLSPVWFAGDQVDRVVLHPDSARSLFDLLGPPVSSSSTQTVLAVGPEGGFIEAELGSFERANYTPARLDTGPLRTEVAVAAALGQLVLLRPR